MITKTHRFSSCFSLEIENGISPRISLKDKSLRTQRNIQVHIESLWGLKYKLNSVLLAVNWETYKLINEEQSPISSGIWPDSRFSFRSLNQTNRKEDKQTYIYNKTWMNTKLSKGKHWYLHRNQALKAPYCRRNFAFKIKPWKIAAIEGIDCFSSTIKKIWRRIYTNYNVQGNSQCNNIECDIITWDPSPSTIIWCWWVCPII